MNGHQMHSFPALKPLPVEETFREVSFPEKKRLPLSSAQRRLVKRQHNRRARRQRKDLDL